MNRTVFIMCILIGVAAQAQKSNLQRLQNQLPQLEGREKVTALNNLAEKLKFDQPKEAASYAEEALKLSENIKYQNGIYTSAFHLGIYERDQQNYRKATRQVEKAIQAAKASNQQNNLLRAYKLQELIYRLRNQKKKASEYAQAFAQLKNKMELAKRNQEVEQLEQEVQTKDQALEETGQAVLKAEQEKEEILGTLRLAEAQKLQQETELARLEQESAELEKEAAILEKETALQELKLEEERNLRNIALALAGILVLLILVSWQRYQFVQERKLAEIEKQRVARLEEIDRLKDQFLANTSHELRTPLNGIIGIAEWLQENKVTIDPQVMEENLSLVISSGKRLNNLVNDIMDFSKLNNAELDLSLKALDMYALVDIVLKINQPLLKGKELELINHISKNTPPVFADENRLQQILHNLIGNAIKFTESGQIIIQARPVGELLEISVQDTGIGIPEEKQNTIFQAFQQADGSAIRNYQGTGLGLSITKNLVELHGGRIRLESKEGEGATFYFTIPISEVAAEKMQFELEKKTSTLLRWDGVDNPQPGPSTAVNNDERISILIVDDEPINQHVLSNHLSSEHYQVTTALNGKEALQVIDSNNHFDLVLLDVMMPHMSGYEVCEKIREKYLPSELPVIMVTAKNLVKDLVQGLNMGANDYLAKPFSRGELLARVKTQINLNVINRAMGRFVPNDFLRSLGRENITEVLLGDQVEREVTVLFCDIRDFTRLSENMTPDENFKFVNAFNRRMGPIITAHNGFINQYLGDAIMAIFSQSPADALAASIEMQKNLQEYNKVRQARNRQAIRMGIGFHTGRLIMGITGDQSRLDATTISDTVNTASRMESLTKHYGTNILFSEDSLSQIEDQAPFNLRYLGKVQMKGKKIPVGIYECFDGDLQNQIEQKNKTKSLFEEGLDNYFEKSFSKAIKAFETVVKHNPLDRTAQVFLNKCKDFLVNGVSHLWTGVEVRKDK